MEHVVFYSGPDGTPAFGRFPSMAEAVSFVERLHNDEGETEASLFALTPVPLTVRTVYRVEVAPTDWSDAAAASSDSQLVSAGAEPDAGGFFSH